MKKSRFTEAQIIRILNEYDSEKKPLTSVENTGFFVISQIIVAQHYK